MGGATLAGLLVSQGRAVALGALAAANCQFHHRFGLSVSDHYGHPRLRVGQVRAARACFVALSLSALRQPLGAACLEKTHSPMGSACPEPMTGLSHQLLHVAQIGFFNDPAGRTPSELLESWATLGDGAEGAGRCGARV